MKIHIRDKDGVTLTFFNDDSFPGKWLAEVTDEDGEDAGWVYVTPDKLRAAADLIEGTTTNEVYL